MPSSLQEARAALPQAAHAVFRTEPEAHSIGIGRVEDGQLGFVVEYRAPTRARPLSHHLPDRVGLWPLTWRRTAARATPLHRWPRAALPLSGVRQPEQQATRPLVCGLEIQNIDSDQRAGVLPHGGFVGTLGCFVATAAGEVAMLSNAHVLAESCQGRVGHDRILQGGCVAFRPTHHVAHLGAFMPLVGCPAGTLWGDPAVTPNQADAAIAPLLPGIGHHQAFLAARAMPQPHATAAPQLGDAVFKVGRTTGLTHGVVDRVNVIYSVPYDQGDCWFEDLFSVVTDDGTDFADGGDSGSIVLRHDGTVLGLLFAGAPMGTLCSEIETVLTGLGCTLL